MVTCPNPVYCWKRQGIEFEAAEPGTWAFHCHSLHHVTNDSVEPADLTLDINASKANLCSSPVIQEGPCRLYGNRDLLGLVNLRMRIGQIEMDNY